MHKENDTNSNPSLKSGHTNCCLQLRIFLSGYMNASTCHGIYTICARTTILPIEFENQGYLPCLRLSSNAGRRDEPRHTSNTYPYQRLPPAGCQHSNAGCSLVVDLGKKIHWLMRYLLFIILFTVLSVLCSSRTCKLLCTIVSPFSDTTWAVSNGWLYYWMGFLCCSVALCMRIDSQRHTSRFQAVFTAKRIIQGAKVCKAGGETILYEGIPRELTAIPSKNFSTRDNTS